MSANSVTVLDWPAKSPDLNSIENLWGILVFQAYGGGKQDTNVEELTRLVMKAWKRVESNLMIDELKVYKTVVSVF